MLRLANLNESVCVQADLRMATCIQKRRTPHSLEKYDRSSPEFHFKERANARRKNCPQSGTVRSNMLTRGGVN